MYTHTYIHIHIYGKKNTYTLFKITNIHYKLLIMMTILLLATSAQINLLLFPLKLYHKQINLLLSLLKPSGNLYQVISGKVAKNNEVSKQAEYALVHQLQGGRGSIF